MAFTVVTTTYGGQQIQYRDIAVEANDLVWALGTDNGGNCQLSLSNVTAELIGTEVRDGGRMRISVWKAKAAGTARVTISGSGSNWDMVIAVARPDADRRWKLVVLYDAPEPSSVGLEAEVGNPIFIIQHHGTGVANAPSVAGISYNTVYDILPEGSGGPSDGHMTIIDPTSVGTATISSSTAYLMVGYITPVAWRRRVQFVWV